MSRLAVRGRDLLAPPAQLASGRCEPFGPGPLLDGLKAFIAAKRRP